MNSGDTGLWSSGFNPPDNLEFLEIGRLWWLAILGVLLVAYVAMQFVRRRAAVRFTQVKLLDKIAPERPGWRRHIPAFFLLSGLALAVLAYAEPAAVTEVPSERATIMLAIDTSLSMQAEDVTPNRFDGAKAAATAFLDEVPPEINIGLVSFNGIASVRVPPTQNRAAVRSAVQSLDLGESTAIGEAILASLSALEDFITEFEGDAPPARIVLMSDGETQVGRPDAVAVDAARAAGIAVSTIAFGTDSGVSKHGDNAKEFQYMVTAGMSPMEAIESASTVAAEHIQMDDVRLDSGGQIATSTQGGGAGAIRLDVTNEVLLQGEDATANPSGLFSRALDPGRAAGGLAQLSRFVLSPAPPRRTIGAA